MSLKKRGRGGGPRALAAAAARITKPIFGKRGFAEGAILNDWETIIGPQLAAHSSPERIVFRQGERQGGTLHLLIDSGSLAVELQHLEPMLIERINGFFGYGAVAHVKIVQGVIPPPSQDAPVSPETPRRSLDAAEEKDLIRHLANVDDPELRAALEKLGRSVMRARPGRS